MTIGKFMLVQLRKMQTNQEMSNKFVYYHGVKSILEAVDLQDKWLKENNVNPRF